jgi:hypothetical protein
MGGDNMNHTEMKSMILFKYHKSIDFWHELLGEFFEATEGFTKPWCKQYPLDGKQAIITWDQSWSVTEI